MEELFMRWKLTTLIENHVDKEERYMCEALHELFAEDVEKAAEEAAQRINALNKILAEQNRTADIIISIT